MFTNCYVSKTFLLFGLLLSFWSLNSWLISVYSLSLYLAYIIYDVKVKQKVCKIFKKGRNLLSHTYQNVWFKKKSMKGR